MLKQMLVGLLCLSALTTSARRNSTHIGFLSGTTGIRKTHDVTHHRSLGNNDNFAVSFTTDINFDKRGSRIYLSIPVRLHTIRFDVTEIYPNPRYPGTNITMSENGRVTAASLGAGLALNYIPVGDDKFALLTNLSVLPLAEVGDFMGGTRINGVAELYAGIRINNRLMIGSRAVGFFRDYKLNNFSLPDRNGYSVLNVMFDMRFNISARK